MDEIVNTMTTIGLWASTVTCALSPEKARLTGKLVMVRASALIITTLYSVCQLDVQEMKILE